jgi:membrane protease YdiL (CAAX protease family)
MAPLTPERNRIAWAVVLYLGITFLASYALWMYVIIVPKSSGAFIFGSIFPAIAAIATLLICRLPLDELGWRLPKARMLLWGWLTPIGYALTAYAPVWLVPAFGGLAPPFRHTPDAWSVVLTSGALALTLGVLQGLPFAAGEEFGWQGFLLPNLTKLFDSRRALILTGAVWALWHYPLILAGPFHGFGPLWYQLICFTLLSINLAVIFGFFRLRSGSTWPSVLAAATSGVFIQTVLDPITGTTPLSPWLSGEFGVFLVVTTGVVAWWCWRDAPTLAAWERTYRVD